MGRAHAYKKGKKNRKILSVSDSEFSALFLVPLKCGLSFDERVRAQHRGKRVRVLTVLTVFTSSSA